MKIKSNAKETHSNTPLHARYQMCIYLMKNQPKEVAERFSQCYVGDVVISAITYAELEYGVAMSANPAKERLNLASLVEEGCPPSIKSLALLMGLFASQPEKANKIIWTN